MMLTLHGFAGGRFMLGVGSGWLDEEFDALGVPFAERGARFDETLAVLRAAWSGAELEGTGVHYPFARVLVTEEPVRVPLILGGNTDRAMRRAARLADGWFSSSKPTSTRPYGCANGWASSAKSSAGSGRCRSTCAWPVGIRTRWPAMRTTASST